MTFNSCKITNIKHLVTCSANYFYYRDIFLPFQYIIMFNFPPSLKTLMSNTHVNSSEIPLRK